MFGGVALPLDSVPPALIAQHDLSIRVYNRCGVDELHFLAREVSRLLPVLLNGVLRILTWGNRRGDSAKLPPPLWTSLNTIEVSGWGDARIEEAVIPATLAFDNGIWYTVSVGVRGLVVPDEKGVRRVYIICEPSSDAYAIMTKAKWMPCLVDQAITCRRGRDTLPARAIPGSRPRNTLPAR